MAYQTPITKISKYFPLMEIVSLVALVVGFALKATDIIILSLSTLSAVYFLSANAPRIPMDNGAGSPEPQTFSVLLGRTIVPKIMGIGSSIMVVGVEFALMHWNGFREMLLIGTTSLAGASVIGLITTMNDDVSRKAIGSWLLRAVPLMLIGIYLLKVHGLKNPN